MNTVKIEASYTPDELQKTYKELDDEQLKAELEAVNKELDKIYKAEKIVNAYKRLKSNEDFLTLFEEGFFDEEVKRVNELIVGDKGYVPRNLKRDQIENLVDKLLSVRHLKIYFVELDAKADNIPQAKVDMELAKRELKKEIEFRNKKGGK